MLAYIPFIYFTLWLIRHIANPHMRFGAGAMSLLWIDTSAFFSILVDIRNIYGQFGCNEFALSWMGVLLYCALWTIILLPLTKLDQVDIEIQPLESKQTLFKFICIFLIICMFIHMAIAGSISNIREQIIMDLSDAYSEKLSRDSYSGGAGAMWQWIPNIVALFTPLYLLCWFISITICKQSKLISSLLLLSSTLGMIVGFVNGGRASLFWWIITFLVYLFLFKPSLSPVQRKRIGLTFISFAGCAFLGIVLITLARFEDGSMQALDSFIGYAGQQVNNFCAFLPHADFFHLYPDRLFPLYQYVVKNQSYDMLEFYSYLSSIYPIKMNVFFTVFGGLLVDTGVLGLLVFLVLYILATRYLRYSINNKITIPYLFILSLILCIPIRGLFGWPFTNYHNTLYIIFNICLLLCFKYHIKYGRKTIV